MNVSHKYKTCYIHIPKTGGSTIEYIKNILITLFVQ